MSTPPPTTAVSAGRRMALAAVAAALLALLPSCLQHEDPNTFRIQGQAPSSPPPAVPGAYGYPAEPPVSDATTLRAFVDRYRHRVVLLDFWTGWCGRCRSEMPLLVRLQDDVRASGFQVISCNLDEPSRWSVLTLPFLRSIEANFPCLIVPRDEKLPLSVWLGSDWNYAVPARFLIDGNGAVVARFFDDASIDQVIAAVERALRGTRGASLAGPGPGAELRFRLVDVATGETIPFPAVFSAAADAERMAERVADAVASAVEGRTRRLAILPFAHRGSPTADLPLGRRLADAVIRRLRQRGYLDLLEPAAARRECEVLGLSPVAIEFDPAVIRNRFPADYLLIGWLGGAEAYGPATHRTAESVASGVRIDSAAARPNGR